MSQTVVAPPEAAPGTPPGVPAQGPAESRLTAGMASLRHALEGSPGRLRLVSALCVVACVLAGVLGGYALQRRSAALDDARASAAHLVLLQTVQTQLVEADADATNGYLSLGQEPFLTQQDYLAAIEGASAGLARAARTSSGADDRLTGVNVALNRYVGYIASARADKRKQIPVGASYLQIASSSMRSQIIPALQKLADADSAEIDNAYSRAGNARWWLILAGLLGLGVLIGGQFYLTQHSRRLVNPPAAGATAGLIVVLLICSVVMSGAQSRANTVRSGDLAEAIAISNSRVAAFNAKSLESLTLVARGSGPVNEPLWNKSFTQAQDTLPGDVLGAANALTAYQKQHQKIRGLDDSNRWKEATQLAGRFGTATANAAFSEYADATRTALQARARGVSSGLADAGDFLFLTGLLVLLIGILAAAGAWYGVSLRLDEYR